MASLGGASRAASARIVHAVINEQRSLSAAAPSIIGALADARDRAFAQTCAYGVLRHYHALSQRLATLLSRPMRRRDADIEALLLVGLMQVDWLGLPEHAAVSATVDGARALDKEWACRLINGVLRNAIRHPRRARAEGDADAMSEFPPWLVETTQADWPTQWPAILAAANTQAPLTLRVNRRRVSVAAYCELLHAAGFAPRRTRHAMHAVTLGDPTAIEDLPQFDAGFISVQDEAAQLAAPLLGARAGERVLDACAAPGGKTAHLLELTEIDLLALDRSPARLALVALNLERLGLRCELRAGDASVPETWWDGRMFDRILVDAPCSALGVARRHPDIRLRRRPADITDRAREQARILRALWPLLRPGGTLLYATCTFLRAENDAALAALCAAHSDARALEPGVEWGEKTTYGRQILPGEDGMDGFYYALLSKCG